ncbi:BRCA2 repeat/BRCA2, oligonucleotide/oligosaccharide-binding, domain 1, putative [Leishmania shawi]|uniref:BRCA2 repeat/BRCA2, oligonucleotide/oligosaccharide-binding, domain 1 n=1 Tax=Leishmania shawi TaxID=5680 RepID=A0ABR3E960_9TRYP
MKVIACPHCTFINLPSKVKCGVCLRLLRKRESNIDDGSTTSAHRERKEAQPPTFTSPEHGTSKQHSEHDSPETCELYVRDSTARSLMPPVAPESSMEATVHVVQPPDVEAISAPPPVVTTLFSTASGKPVTVRRESLQKVAERLGDLTDLDVAARVPALFNTDNGKAATVPKTSLAKAPPSADGRGAAAARSTSALTLFATPGSAPVTVPAVALPKPPEPLELRSLLDKCEIANTGTVHSAVGPRQTPRAAAPPMGLTTSSPEHSFRAPAPHIIGGQRRGFVPPQRRCTAEALAKPSATAPQIQPTVLTALRFNPDACSCRSVAPSPSLSSITSLAFSFKGSDCGSVLGALLGASSTETVQVGQWHAMLIKLGASPNHCTIKWCRHALVSAMARMHFMATASSGALSSAFSPLTVLLCVMQMYNAEMVNGERPALRKMVEGDISSTSLVVLCMSSICEERNSPHMRIVTLSDGVYHLKVTCDVPLSSLIREGVLRPGQRMAVCGAKSLLHGQCAPTECEEQVVLSINYNCVRAVAQQTPLGVCNGEPLPLPLSLVHPLGGLVPAIEGVVARVLPSFFISQEVEASATTADGAPDVRHRVVKTVRSTHAQLQVSDRLRREVEAPAGGDAAEPKPLLRVTSLLVVNDKAEALLQQWERVDERALLTDDDEGTSLPVEGSWVTLYAVNPAKSRTAATPFSRAKLFFSSRKLHYVPSKGPLQHLRRIWQSTTDYSSITGVGDVADVCGLYMGSHRNNQGTFVLLLMRNDTYAFLQIPAPSVGRVLSLPIPTTERLPLVLLNATFLTGEDSVAGSDCCRLFANEYTVLLQRSMQANLKEALETAAQLRGLVDAVPQKYASRRAEVFRCLDEGDPSGGLGFSSTTLSSCGALSAPEVPPNVWRDAPPVNSGAAATPPVPQQREGRLPYYLRQDNNSRRAGKLQGVVLSSSIPLIPAGPTAIQGPYGATTVHPGVCESLTRPPNLVVADRSHHYGNIADLMFLFDPPLNRRAWHPLTDPIQATHASAAQQGEHFKYVQLCWRLSADSADDMTCRLGEISALGTVLESVCPLQELCSVIADERHIDVSLARSERLLQWRRQDALSVWWRFFTNSRVLDTPADLDGASSQYLWWLPVEWAEAMRTVNAKLQLAFFFFSLSGEVLRHVRLISDCCNVAELPCD